MNIVQPEFFYSGFCKWSYLKSKFVFLRFCTFHSLRGIFASKADTAPWASPTITLPLTYHVCTSTFYLSLHIALPFWCTGLLMQLVGPVHWCGLSGTARLLKMHGILWCCDIYSTLANSHSKTYICRSIAGRRAWVEKVAGKSSLTFGCVCGLSTARRCVLFGWSVQCDIVW